MALKKVFKILTENDSAVKLNNYNLKADFYEKTMLLLDYKNSDLYL